MKTNRKAAVLALGLALLSPLAGARTVDTEWWRVDFTSPTPEGKNKLDAVVGGIELFDGDSVSVLTNTTVSTVEGVTYKPAYASGFWYMAEGDESVITNSVVTNALDGTSETSLHIKLDTQGNDLRWEPSNAVPGVVNLVDADLLLVGSDSAPDASDFDPTNASKHVQAAIYLKNEIDPDSGETTNSILCVYAYNTGVGKEEWMELEDVTGTVVIEDNTWHHVQVQIDYTGGNPTILVNVDGRPMTLRSGGTITAANTDEAKNASRVREVCFRGTGEFDNFVGKTRVEEVQNLWFETKVYLDGNEMTEEEIAGYGADWILFVQASVGDLDGTATRAEFRELWSTDSDIYNFVDPEWCLDKVVLHRFGTPATTETYGYHWNGTDYQVDPDDGIGNPEEINLSIVEGEGAQDGYLNLFPLTNGATNPTNLIAEVYFKTVGAFNANAVTTVGGTATTNSTILKPVAAGGTYPTNLVWTFNATDGANILTGIRVENGATATYAPGANAGDGVATVTVTVSEALAADTTFVTATYAEGSYTEAPSWIDNKDGTYTLGNYVAKIAGDEPRFYPSLREAIDNAAAGDTVVLLADDRVSFSAEDHELPITKALTIDGGSNTLYGVTDYATADGSGNSDHDIYIGGSGNVTIKNLTLSEFSDTAPTVQYRTYPIWTGQKYAGTLVLDGVTVTNYARTAVNLSGGSFLITNCVFAGYADAASPTRYYQDAVVVFNATGTVANTTVTGVGDANTGYGASVFTVNSSGAGEITVKSGSYTGAYIAAVNSNATGRITIEGGTFVATNTNGEDEKPDTAFEPANTVGKIVITGGWFNLEPEAEFLAAGLQARKLKADSDPAPWTVGQVFTVNFWTGDELDGAPAYWTTNAFTGETGYGPAADPTKDATAGATYAFAGWTNEVAGGAAVATADLPAVDGAASWLAVWTETANTFDVTFMNGEAQFATTNVAYGTTEYAPTGTPTKAATAQFTYAFAGWSDTADGEALASLPAVTNDATFYAAFTATTNEYTITWTMDDDSVIDTTTVAYGTVPTHADAEKASDAQYAYTFNGWDPEPVAVTGEATYKATFLPVLRSYDITFWTGLEPVGGQAFHATNVPYGTLGADYAPTNDPATYVANDKEYTFAAWTNEVAGGAAVATADLPDVEGEAAWTAVWTSKDIFEVTFTNGRALLEALSTNVVDGTQLAAPVLAADPEYTDVATPGYEYRFAGWALPGADEAVEWPQTITGDVGYHAVFTSNLLSYAIAFSTNGAVYATTNAPYGTTDYGPADPAWEGHAFAGWTNAVSGAFVAQGTAVFPAVAGEAEWTAVWTEDAQAPEVNAGQGLDTYVPEAGETVPPAIDFVAGAAAGDPDRCAVSFVAPATGWYLLMACDHVSADDADYQPDYGSKVEVTAATVLKPVTLVETSNATVKFFKIGWSKTEPVQP